MAVHVNPVFRFLPSTARALSDELLDHKPLSITNWCAVELEAAICGKDTCIYTYNALPFRGMAERALKSTRRFLSWRRADALTPGVTSNVLDLTSFSRQLRTNVFEERRLQIKLLQVRATPVLLRPPNQNSR